MTKIQFLTTRRAQTLDPVTFKITRCLVIPKRRRKKEELQAIKQENIPEGLTREKMVLRSAPKTWKVLGSLSSETGMRFIQLGIIINGLLTCVLLILTLLLIFGVLSNGECRCLATQGILVLL